MTKKELLTAQDSEIIVDYIKSYCLECMNTNFGGPTKALAKHLAHLDAEMLRRGLLTQDQIDFLNS